MTTSARQARVRAPELVGRGGWVNTGGKAYGIADLRGRFVLLDFWTFCCINCLHVIEELRPLEEKYAERWSSSASTRPKFVHEADHDAVVAAVERYDVRPPGPRRPRPHDLGRLRRPGVADARAGRPRGLRRRAVLRRGPCARDRRPAGRARRRARPPRARCTAAPVPYVAPEPVSTTLRFPAKAVVLPSGTILVADAGHHSLAELAGGRRDARTPHRQRRARAGRRAARRRRASTSPAACASCRRPSPPSVGYDVVVADTVNHALRGVELASTAASRTVAGTGEQWMQGQPRPTARRRRDREQPLSSPWDVAWSPETERGRRRHGRHPPALALRPGRARTIAPWAGTTNEGLRDGPGRPGLVRPVLGPRGRCRRGDGERLVAGRLRDLEPALAYAPASSMTHVGTRAVRLRAPRRAGRGRDAAAPARGHRAARRLGRGPRHLQRRRTPLRPGRPREVSTARHRAARAVGRRARPRQRRTGRRTCWWSSPRRTGSPGSGCRTSRCASTRRPTAPDAAAPTSRPARSSWRSCSSRRPGRSSTTATARRRGCWCRRRPPGCSSPARAAAPR